MYMGPNHMQPRGQPRSFEACVTGQEHALIVIRFHGYSPDNRIRSIDDMACPGQIRMAQSTSLSGRKDSLPNEPCKYAARIRGSQRNAWPSSRVHFSVSCLVIAITCSYQTGRSCAIPNRPDIADWAHIEWHRLPAGALEFGLLRTWDGMPSRPTAPENRSSPPLHSQLFQRAAKRAKVAKRKIEWMLSCLAAFETNRAHEKNLMILTNARRDCCRITLDRLERSSAYPVFDHIVFLLNGIRRWPATRFSALETDGRHYAFMYTASSFTSLTAIFLCSPSA